MKRTTLALLPLLALLLLAGTSYGQTAPTEVPTGPPPVIDGTLGADEWKDALAVELAPEGEAFLLQDEEALYVGVRVGSNCIPSIALLHGDKILVLHASASLGTAEYVRSGDAWEATRSFTWRCRNGRTSDEDRARFLVDEGWRSSTTGDGRRGEAEYRIERRLLEDEAPRLAIVVCRLQPMPPTACAWPGTVKDGARDQDLIFGKTPNLAFDPDGWARLALGPAKTPAERLDAALDEVESAADPVGAYHALLELFDEHGEVAVGSERAQRIRKSLEKRKANADEVKAQRRLESALKLVRKKLQELAEKYPDTRAARIARERIEALEP